MADTRLASSSFKSGNRLTTKAPLWFVDHGLTLIRAMAAMAISRMAVPRAILSPRVGASGS
jgi:hypothetical protein